MRASRFNGQQSFLRTTEWQELSRGHLNFHIRGRGWTIVGVPATTVVVRHGVAGRRRVRSGIRPVRPFVRIAVLVRIEPTAVPSARRSGQGRRWWRGVGNNGRSRRVRREWLRRRCWLRGVVAIIQRRWRRRWTSQRQQFVRGETPQRLWGVFHTKGGPARGRCGRVVF